MSLTWRAAKPQRHPAGAPRGPARGRLAATCVAGLLATAAGVPPATAAPADEDSPARVLRVKAVADERFREKKNWEKEIREHVAWSDKKLRELAGIGFEIVAIEPWTTHGSAAMTLLLNELEAGVAKDSAEVVIGFTGHPPPVTMMFLPGGPVRYPLPFTAGIAFPLGDRAVVRRTEWKKLTRHTLVHEVAHLFGGLHVDEKSLLESGTDSTSFDLDPFNRQVLALTRDRDFDRDVRDLPREQLEALVDLYRQAPLKDEADPDTAIRIGYLYLMAGEVDEALDEFKQAMEIAPEQSRDILRFAIIPELEAWAEENEPTIRTRYMLAQAYAVAERWSDAALELQPGCTEPHVDAASCALLGAVYLKAGQLSMAQRALVAALERDDTLADAHNSLAGVYAAAGEYEAALESFARAQELEPGQVDTHFNKGLTYLAAGRPGAAEASFREVLRLREANDFARAKLAVALARQEKDKEARKLIRPFEDRRTLSAYILRDMAEVYYLAGDTKKAHERLQLAKKGGIDVEAVEAMIREGTRRPRKVEVDDLIEQAEAYYHTGSHDTARALLGQAAEEKPREPRVHYWLGRVAAAEKDEEAARAHFHKSLEVDADFDYSRFQLGWLAYRSESYEEAASWLATYVESEDAGSNAHYMLGRSYFHLDRLEDAERHLRAAIRKRSDYGNAFYFLARVFLEQGRDEEARRELELAVDSRSLPEWRREDAHLRLARLAEAAGEEAAAARHARVALRLGASEPRGPVAAPVPSGVGSLAVEGIEPSVATVLGRGEPVRLVATVRYDLTGADRGAVFLAPQDAGGASLVPTQPTVAVQRGSGRLVLRASFDAPEAGDHIDVFVALHAEGQPTTNAVTRVRYTLE